MDRGTAGDEKEKVFTLIESGNRIPVLGVKPPKTWKVIDVESGQRLFARNDRNLSAAFDHRHKVIAVPTDSDLRWQLYDRASDPGEARDVARTRTDDARVWRRELELFLERAEREWAHTRRLLGDKPGAGRMTPEACAQLKALGYTGIAGCE